MTPSSRARDDAYPEMPRGRERALELPTDIRRCRAGRRRRYADRMERALWLEQMRYVQPKTAFSRFPPVHRAALKGQFRVDSGPIARQRSLKPASALPPIGGWGITTNEQVRDAARSARPRSSPFTVSASGCLPRPVSGASGVAPSATERSQERLRGRNPESAPGLPLAHMNCIQKGALAQRLRASRMAASRSRPRTEALCVCTSCL
jgi:hypothetical protein